MNYRHYEPDAELARWILELPKTETHLHLEGSVSHQQLQQFNPEQYLGEPDFWQPDFRFNGFSAFQEQFDNWIIPYHANIDRYRETARHVFAKCHAEGCRYVEASFHLPTLAMMDCSGPELLAAIIETAPRDLDVRIFGGIRHNDFEPQQSLLEDALTWDALTGIDLHGPETLAVDPGIPDYWRRAHDHGKVTKAHAGEFMSHEFVSWAIDALGVKRIQHGVRAMESDELIKRLAGEGVVLDMCPISNLKLGVQGISAMSDHPVKRFMDAGVSVTVSTDDTFLFGNSLVEEYTALVQDLGCTKEDLIQVARNGFEVSQLSSTQKTAIQTELDTLVQTI